jgi:hypothetical protein
MSSVIQKQWDLKIRGSCSLGKKGGFIPKITGAKRAGNMAHATECLSRKHKSLSSNPRAGKVTQKPL